MSRIANILNRSFALTRLRACYSAPKEDLGTTLSYSIKSSCEAPVLGLENCEYDPYGNVIAKNGPLADDNPIRFSTKYFDQETGLGYWTYRYYSPSLGRWLNRDPLEEDSGSNLYSMVKNDLINEFDYWGLITVKRLSLEKGDCGGYFVKWEFKLDKPAPCDGYIIQKITYEKINYDCIIKKDFISKEIFWESWLVKKGEQISWVQGSTGYTDGSANRCIERTKGELKVTGEIKFFCLKTTGDLGDFGKEPKSTPHSKSTWGVGMNPQSGDLTSTNIKPNWCEKDDGTLLAMLT